MRPDSIKKFEILYLFSLLASALATAFRWNLNSEAFLQLDVGRQLGLGFYVAIAIADNLIPLALWYFAARKRSRIAKWRILGIFVIQALSILKAVLQVSLPGGLAGVLGLMILGLRGAAVSFLFRPTATAWFEGRPEVDPEQSPDAADR